jgi:hypothetical protein
MKIKFTLFRSLGSPVTDENRFEFDWEDVALALSEHQIIENKEDIQLITPASFLSYEDAIRFNDYGNQILVKRCKENLDKWYMLPIDIDGEMTIDEAKKRYNDYEYVLYTSYNHQVNGIDKFRLFLPLKTPVTNEVMHAKIGNIKTWIHGADKTTTSQSRQFYLPSCSSKNKDKCYSYHNKGKFLDILEFNDDLKPEVKLTNHGPIDEDMKTAILDFLKEYGTVEYDTWWKIACAMQDGGYTFAEFEDVSRYLRSHRPDRNCEGQWHSSEGSEVSFGYLVNLITNRFGKDKLSQLTHEIREQAYSSAPLKDFVKRMKKK